MIHLLADIYNAQRALCVVASFYTPYTL